MSVHERPLVSRDILSFFFPLLEDHHPQGGERRHARGRDRQRAEGEPQDRAVSHAESIEVIGK